MKRDSLRQQQVAADGAFAARLVVACAALALMLWVALPSCEQKEQGESSLLGRAFANAPAPPVAAFSGKVARTIHQVVAPEQLPEVLQELQGTWKHHHSGWEYRQWTHGEVAALAEKHLPSFSHAFQRMRPEEKDMAARYIILYALGGVFAERDVASLRPIEPLVRGCAGLVALLSDDLGFEENVPPALLASAPGHPLWVDVLEATHALTRGGRWHLPHGLSHAAVLKAATARYLELHGGNKDSAAAAVAARLSGVEAVRARAALHVRALRVPGLCVAPGGTAFPWDWHVSPMDRTPEAERAKRFQACSTSSRAFSRAGCDHLLGSSSAAAFTIAYWERAPQHGLGVAALHRLKAWSPGARAAGAIGAIFVAAAAAALIGRAAVALAEAMRRRGAGGGSGGSARRSSGSRGSSGSSKHSRHRGDKAALYQDPLLRQQIDELA